MTRVLCAGYPALGLLLTLLGMFGADQAISIIFDSSYVSVVSSFHVWALVIGPFGRSLGDNPMDFLMILFEIYMMMVYFPARERDLGSTTFVAWVGLYNTLISTVFLIAMKIMSIAQDARKLFMPVTGLWPLIMLCLTQRCLANPTSTTNFFGLVEVPNKWYPLVLAGFFMLMSGMTIPWSIIAALAVGYGSLYVPFDRCLPSSVRANGIERRCGCLIRRPCLGAPWIMATDTAAFELESGDRRYATLRDFGRGGATQLATQGRTVQPPSRGSNAFTAFSGSGNRLGDADGVPPGPVEMRPTAPPASAPAPTSNPAVTSNSPDGAAQNDGGHA